jgi:hypothetical protein
MGGGVSKLGWGLARGPVLRDNDVTAMLGKLRRESKKF